MAKKQFIRHLEFYGFPDQNGYSSDINGVDLSEIIEKNKEQDKEIQDLEGEKASKKDLNELSGTVETLISAQTEFNNVMVETLSGITNDINTLKEIDNEFGQQLSALTDGVNDAMDAVQILGDRVDDVEDAISGINESIETIIEDYAKKEDVYSKEEIDEMISSGFSGYATQEWVEEQGYLTEESGDTRYAKIEDLQDLASQVESAATDIDEVNEAIDEINDKIDTLNDDLSAFSEDVSDALSDINDAVSGINNSINDINDKVDDITSDIGELAEIVSGNTDAIGELNELVAENAEAINNLDDRVDELEEAVSALTADVEELDTKKADKSTVYDLREEMLQGLSDLENKKANKTDLEAVSGAVDALDAKIDAEIARSTSADTAMQQKINELDEEVQEAVEKVEEYDDRIEALESGLAQEIIDRQNGDIALIGTSSDSGSADTIWGAKNLAEEYKNEAIASANTYTDDKVAVFNGQLENLEDRIEQQMSQFATEDFVISACNDTETEIRGEFGTALNNEIERAEHAETNLEVQIQSLLAQILSNTDHISNNSSRLNAITRWQGTNPEEYDDSGNGILDVLHREFHEYEKTHGAIKSIEYVDGNLVITYETPDGEKQEIIPISELIVLDNYYTKEEADALLDEKLDKSDYDDISEQVSANTENISILDDAIANLIEKLGYSNNDTLVTNNEHEVAFGEYNVSNTSEDASGQTIFSIGNGTSDGVRSNAVEVRKNGDLYLWIEGEFMNVNKLLAQIAHEIY